MKFITEPEDVVFHVVHKKLTKKQAQQISDFIKNKNIKKENVKISV